MPEAKKLQDLSTNIDYLGHVSLLKDLHHNSEALEVFASYLHLREFDEGEKIMSEGDMERCMYLLVKGSVDVYKLTPDGDRFRVATISSQDYAYIGEGALLHDSPRSSTVQATSHTICLVMTRVKFEEFCRERPEWAVG